MKKIEIVGMIALAIAGHAGAAGVQQSGSPIASPSGVRVELLGEGPTPSFDGTGFAQSFGISFGHGF